MGERHRQHAHQRMYPDFVIRPVKLRLPVQPGGLFPIAKRIFHMPPIAVGRHNLGGRPLRVIREENRFAPMGIAPRHTRIVFQPPWW